MNETALVAALEGCNFHPLLMIVQRALTRSGLGDVEILDRRKTSQKSRNGGHELVCRVRMGDRMLTVVVKVIKDGIRLRMCDEHVGVIDRMRADFGIIVSTKKLSRNAAKALATYGHARVEVIDGPGLADLVRRTEIGVRPDGSPDYAFFGDLEDKSKRIINCLQP